MKDLSFGKLMGIFAGSLAVLILITVVIINAAAGAKARNKVVTQRHPTEFEQPQPDILAEQLRREQEIAAASREAIAQQLQALQQAIQQQSQTVRQHLDSLHAAMQTLEQRIAALENSRRSSSVQIIKPAYQPRPPEAPQLEEKASPLPASSGYRVQAIVGKRVWVSTTTQEESVTLGETLPAPDKALLTRQGQGENTNAISTTAR